ncbi:MAG: hypothetical protein GYB68_13685 [Chloroflexi bacterium]|nr:hypothetical protein [Chloroflexota bacterium]
MSSFRINQNLQADTIRLTLEPSYLARRDLSVIAYRLTALLNVSDRPQDLVIDALRIRVNVEAIVLGIAEAKRDMRLEWIDRSLIQHPNVGRMVAIAKSPGLQLVVEELARSRNRPVLVAKSVEEAMHLI